ncbi:MAG: cation:proton antiporter [Pirellulales bacterium]
MSRQPNSFWSAAGYVVMIAGAIVLFLAIRQYGESLAAERPSANVAVQAPAEMHALLHVLLALTAVIVLGRMLGWLFAWVGQPPVIGEVFAGIMLGPSLLGYLAPDVAGYLFPPHIAPQLSVIAQLGVVLYMFLVGLELDRELLRAKAHATLTISQASIVLPFLLGAGLALLLFPTLAPDGVSFTNFSLFIGVSMSITAFPVLARILTDGRLEKTELGVLALTCAAANDVTAWCLLALIVGIARAEVSQALIVIGLTLAYMGAMFWIVRPLAERMADRYDQGPATRNKTALVFIAVLLSALATEYIGVHAIFGAFLLGAIIPHQSMLAREFTDKLEDLVTILLLPAFFAFTGMRTQIGLVSSLQDWAICGLIILVATLGKFGGTLAAARFHGISWRHSSALGVLMNTRGLMELIVLNIGLDLGIISPRLFAMLVIMALVTTLMTMPILRLLERKLMDASASEEGPSVLSVRQRRA